MVSLCSSKSHVSFPFPKWGEEDVKAILKAFANGWNEAKKKYPDIIESGSEEEVTEKLRSAVDGIMRGESVKGFNKTKYESIVRGAKVERFDGTGIDKAPDLTIRKQNIQPGLVDTHFQALFIECKLIEKEKTPLLYIKKGINRFVIGDYAWAMPQALMLAFVRDGKTLPDGLMDFFENNKTNKVVNSCKPKRNVCKVAFKLCASQNAYLTIHNRSWVHAKGKPGDINIYHAWLAA